MTISTITSTLVFLYLADKQRFANYPRRIVYGEIITAVVFLFLALSCFFTLKSDSIYFGYLLFSMFMATIGTSYTQNGSIAVVSLYEPVYTQAVMVGQGLAGIVPPLGSILSALSYQDSDGTTADSTSSSESSSEDTPDLPDSTSSSAQWSSFTYFIVATTLALAAIVLYIYSINKVKVLHEPDEGDYLHYQDDDDSFTEDQVNIDVIEAQELPGSSTESTSFLGNRSPTAKPQQARTTVSRTELLSDASEHPRPALRRTQTMPAIVEDEEALLRGEHHTSISLSKLFVKLRIPSLTVFLVFAVTLAYPVFASRVLSNTYGIPAQIYIPIAFFVWNLGDLLGRILCAFPFMIIERDSYFIIYGIGRLLFVPFFLLSAMSKDRSDLTYLLLHLFFGITNGHLCSNAFIQFPNYLDDTEREAGGGFMTLILSFGLTTGSLFSFVLSMLVNSIAV